MNIILFAHPAFSKSQSMPRYANWLQEGMKKKGHMVQLWQPQPYFYNLPLPNFTKKWLGYLDQYVLFPYKSKKKIRECPPETIFVFTDHVLGPWVHLVNNRPHVIHCHDFLAQQSALNLIPENPTSFTGKIYQAYIRKGYKKSKNFISVSKKTSTDLLSFLDHTPDIAEVVYNGLTQSFYPENARVAISKVQEATDLDLSEGYILHIGSNQWYKNRRGVIEIYNAWRKHFSSKKLPLLMVGSTPPDSLEKVHQSSEFSNDIQFLTGKSDEFVKAAYQGANVFLFPSLAEGFGWPIAEAMASGTPVITTEEAPMTEVAGDAAALIARRPFDNENVDRWARESATTLESIIMLTEKNKKYLIEKGILNTKRFNGDLAINKIEAIYKSIIQKHNL